MSIQSKAGTIILDAVLTELGRKRMSQGKFYISRFSLGDDEIDYSVSYDDAGTYKILSASTAPAFEAFSSEHATITHGLSHIERSDIMYLPTLKFNNLTSTGFNNVNSYYKNRDLDAVYLAVNTETNDKLVETFGDTKHSLQSDVVDQRMIFVESGIEDPDGLLQRTTAYRESFILGPGMLDSSFYIHVDARFVTKVYGPTTTCYFSNRSTGKPNVIFPTLEKTLPLSAPKYLKHFLAHKARGIDNYIYEYTSATVSDLTISTINGPRGTVVATCLGVDDMMKVGSDSATNYKFSSYGTINNNLFGDGNKYDYIDTAIYVEGATTGVKLTIPLRIIRYAGT